jgi:hypothetical protein
MLMSVIFFIFSLLKLVDGPHRKGKGPPISIKPSVLASFVTSSSFRQATFVGKV